MFPAYLTHRAGIDKTLLNTIYSLISEGTSPSLIRNILKEETYLYYDRLRLQYYSCCRDLLFGNSSRNSGDIQLAFSNKSQIVINKFGSLSSSSGYNEAFPSEKYIISLFKKKHDSLRQWYDNRVSMIPVKHLKIDHSHKVTSRIRLNSVKIFNGLFTAMNENHQIRLQNFSFSKSLDEVSPSFKMLSDTMRERNYPNILTVATDNCCKDSAILKDNLTTLNCTTSCAEGKNEKDNPLFTLPKDLEIVIINTDQELDNVLPSITRFLNGNNTIVIGFDCEWVYEKQNGQRKVSLIQISFEKIIYLIRICKMKSLNQQLSEILENSAIIKIGKNVGGDIRKIWRDFNYPMYLKYQKKKIPGVVELGSLARAANLVETGRASLDQICRAALKVRLMKDDITRLSNWESATLSNAQIDYAAIDSYISRILNLKLQGMMPKRAVYSSDVEANQSVYLISNTSSQLIGKGIVLSTEHLSKNELKSINPRNDRIYVKVQEIICPNAQIGIRKKKCQIEIDKSFWVSAHSICLNGDDVQNFQKNKIEMTPNYQFRSVVGDGFHILHKINLPKHVYRKQFFECFREALFKPNEEDMRLIQERLFQGKSEDFQFVLKLWPEYFSKRIR